MNTESELYKAGHPSTWRVGDTLASHFNQWTLLEVCGLENKVRIRPLPANPKTWTENDEREWFSHNQFKLLRRANQQENTEGSGECQSRSNVPDSAGATPAPSTKRGNSEDLAIEQQFVCACCSQHYGYQIEHADVCQYAHTERYMLPLAKAQFRERQLAKKVAEFEASCREGDAASLKDIECNKIYRMPTAEETIPFRHETYTALTGHKFEE